MANSKLNPQGYNYKIDPVNTNPFWDDDTPDGASWITSVRVESENNESKIIYTDNNGDDVTAGTISAPDTSNLLAEVNDAVAEDAAAGYDKHELKETENNGTINSVGSLYLARKQITNIEKSDAGLMVTRVNQDGELSADDIEITGTQGPQGETGPQGPQGETGPQGPQGETGATGATPDISATASVDDTTGTPAVTVTKSGTETAPAFDFAFTGIKGESASGGGWKRVTASDYSTAASYENLDNSNIAIMTRCDLEAANGTTVTMVNIADSTDTQKITASNLSYSLHTNASGAPTISSGTSSVKEISARVPDLAAIYDNTNMMSQVEYIVLNATYISMPKLTIKYKASETTTNVTPTSLPLYGVLLLNRTTGKIYRVTSSINTAVNVVSWVVYYTGLES